MKLLHHKFISAYTIVELAAVIVIIGILAAIAVFSYRGWRDGVAEAEIKSDIVNVNIAMKNAKNWSEGAESGFPVFAEDTVFDGSNAAAKKIFTQSQNVTLTYYSGSKDAYCIEAVSKARPSIYLFFDSQVGGEPKKGTCAGGEGATPVPTSAEYTLFTFDLNAPGCASTVQLPIASPTKDTSSEINWGDGTIEARTTTSPSHTYSKKGRYTVSYKGAITTASGGSVTTANKPCITGVKQWANNISPTTISYIGGANFTSVAEPPHTVTNMDHMFWGATIFNQDISGWNTQQVTSMKGMFVDAKAFNQPIGDWDTANVKILGSGDINCQSGSYVKAGMFEGATAFNQPIGDWDVSKVTDMSGLFRGAKAFNQPIGDWDVSKVTNMSGLFKGATAFNQPIGDWDVSNVTCIVDIFQNTRDFNQPIGDWDVSNVTRMSGVFTGATAFNQPIGDWDVSNVTTMGWVAGAISGYGTFEQATSFNQPIGDWDVSNVTNMNYVFKGAKAFNQPIGDWDVSNVTEMYTIFEGATAFNQPIGDWDVSNVTNMRNAFCSAKVFNQDLSGWNVANVTNWGYWSNSTSPGFCLGALTIANTPPKFR